MTNARAALISTLTALSLAGATAYADNETTEKTQRVETTLPSLKTPTLAGFSLSVQAQPQAEMPDTISNNGDLQADGMLFGWIDADGTPLELTRQNDEIWVRRTDGVTSRLKLTDMSGLIEPQIGASAVAIAN